MRNAMTSSASFVVGIDQNPCGTAAWRLEADGAFVRLFAHDHRQFYPQAGWVEHDALEILERMRAALDAAAGAAGVALSNQGETVVAWNAETGVPLYNALVWHDTRTAGVIDRLREDGAESLLLQRAGLPLDAYSAAAKLRWFIDHVPEARALSRRGKLRLGTLDSFLLDRLCGTHATDVATASRTGLMNLMTGAWDPELCRLFGVPRDCLPAIRPNGFAFGTHAPGAAPVLGSISDRQAALLGHGCHESGQVALTFGAAAYGLAVTGGPPPIPPGSGLLPTVAWQLGPTVTYAVDAGVNNADSALNWARRLGLYASPAELDQFEGPSALARGLVFVPALTGLAAPYWDRDAAGLWLGMDLETGPRDLLRSILEGIALRCAQALRAMADAVALADEVSIDGTLARSRYFRAFLADALDRTVVAPEQPALVAFGAARLAWLGAGLGTLDALPPQMPAPTRVAPRNPLKGDLHTRFADAVQRARHWPAAA
jgi:glycerol kinase